MLQDNHHYIPVPVMMIILLLFNKIEKTYFAIHGHKHA